MILTEGCYQFSVFCFRTDGDTKTILAELYSMTVAHDDALIYKIIVYSDSICHLGKKEIGIRGEDSLADGQQFKCVYHA